MVPLRPFKFSDAERYRTVIGVDEVGRGALCGPVMAAAVWFEAAALPPELLEGLDDSKCLSAREREELAEGIGRHAQVAVRAASSRVIDRRGILEATLDAMQRAIHALGIEAPVVVDGLQTPPGLRLAAEAVVGADRSVPQVAAASIAAKVTRDGLMRRLALRYPGFGWETNVGYGTPEHLRALVRNGATKHHRSSFAPLTQLALDLGPESG
jgi:ribonuclease HII